MVVIKYEFVDKFVVVVIWLLFYNYNVIVLLLYEIVIIYYVVDFVKLKKKLFLFLLWFC